MDTGDWVIKLYHLALTANHLITQSLNFINPKLWPEQMALFPAAPFCLIFKVEITFRLLGIARPDALLHLHWTVAADGLGTV